MDIELIQIRITEGCLVHGEHAERGEELQVDLPTAEMLVAIGKAEFLIPEPVIQNADPQPTNRDPKPAK